MRRSRIKIQKIKKNRALRQVFPIAGEAGKLTSYFLNVPKKLLKHRKSIIQVLSKLFARALPDHPDSMIAILLYRNH